jgi:hypothetical protein
LNILEDKSRLRLRVEAPGLGEANRPLSAKDVKTLEQVRVAAGSLFKNGGSVKALEELGQRLFSTVFQGKVLEVVESARAAARNREKSLLILVKMEPGSHLHSIPWELLHDGYVFLAKDTRSAVVRYFDQPLPVSELAVTPPLRVLVTSASPQDFDPVAFKEEEAAIQQAYGKMAHVVPHRDVSIERLKEIWRQASTLGEPFHVWHHCGHGGERACGNQTEFILYLESEGRKQPVEVDRLQEVVSFCPELRIAVLNVCRGGSHVGLAPALARLNVPVVIGFQHPVYDTAALEFAKTLHDSLLHVPVELAVSLARKSMKINEPDIFDWADVLVFSRRRDRGLLLRLRQPEVDAMVIPTSNIRIKKIKSTHFEGTGMDLEGDRLPDPGRLPGLSTQIDEIEADKAEWTNLKVHGDVSADSRK